MKLILMSLLVLGPCYGMDAMFKKIMKQTAKHTFDAACFGETNKNNYDLAVGAAIEKCMQLAPAIDLINILSPSSPFTSLFPSVNTKNPFRQFQVELDKCIVSSLKVYFSIPGVSGSGPAGVTLEDQEVSRL